MPPALDVRGELGGRAGVDEVAVPVAVAGVDEGEVGDDRLLEDVRPPLPAELELAGLLGRRGQHDRAVGVVAPVVKRALQRLVDDAAREVAQRGR